MSRVGSIECLDTALNLILSTVSWAALTQHVLSQRAEEQTRAPSDPAAVGTFGLPWAVPSSVFMSRFLQM